jgi:hypothetical protein
VREPSPSRDAEGQAQTRTGLRSLTNFRNAGGVIAFSVLGLLGIVGLATGHERTGAVALVIGGPALIFMVARLVSRR